MAEIRKYLRLTDPICARGFSPRRSDWRLVAKINSNAAPLDRLSSDELTSQVQALRASVTSGVSVLDAEIVVPTFALVKEAARRTIGQTHYDVQLLAGIALATSAIAQMQTGEGKTLASTLPAVLHSLAGRGVHVATVNAYLAQRDFEFLRPLYELLGVSVGYARDGDLPPAKRAAYACDVTYATGYELGFDYLRDQVALREKRREPPGRQVRNGLRSTQSETNTVQRGHAFVVIDELDSVLIDEANTPLILSAPSDNQDLPKKACYGAKALVDQLRPGVDFVLDKAQRRISITEAGANKAHLSAPRPAQGISRPWLVYVEQALRAKHLYQRDIHYVVADNEIRIVDEYTGRIFTERSWRDGLHQAIEAKENVPITAERRAIARIARQRYFQMYDRLCGMTGTATGHEAEFYRSYKLPVVLIPLRSPCRRRVLPTQYFAKAEDKWSAIASEVLQHHDRGQPVLVGTRTIANSRRFASLLSHAGVPFRLLNGVQDENEAALIAAAGEPGAITIATNMAGRGTDIKPTDESLQLGGLHVIAAERHESQRIDRQLAGRAARQGDPGSCRFFVSAEDQLLCKRNPLLAAQISDTYQAKPDARCDVAVQRIQSRVEADSYEKRVQLMNHEVWLDQLRASVA